MLRVLSRRVALWATGHETWNSVALLQYRWRNDVAKAPTPPTPPADLPAEIFEWDFLLKSAETEEGKQDVMRLKNLYHETEVLNRKEFNTTVDWAEFEGKVPDSVIQSYKKMYAEALNDFETGKFDPSFDQADWEEKTGAFMKIIRDSAADAEKLMKELDDDNQKTEERQARLKTATIDEELALDPEMAKKVDNAVTKELGYTP